MLQRTADPGTDTLPSEMTSRFLVFGSVLTTQRGVPMRNEPSMMSHPRMMAAERTV